ncbi:hypothetical protein HanRHA438_Chr07g0298841 [Helianthus annuus]|nr:hypothetical protein HanIR_Chr07g0311021 [Helianthus annuus]KAJ0907428.1 hypothetical protein HanRHA438_Chr07g0298841 [Helianthus annuus]
MDETVVGDGDLRWLHGLKSGDCWVLNGVYEDEQRRRWSEKMMVVITGPVFR